MNSQSTTENQSHGASLPQSEVNQQNWETLAAQDVAESQRKMGQVTYQDGSTNTEPGETSQGPDWDKASENITKLIQAHKQGGDKALDEAIKAIRGDKG